MKGAFDHGSQVSAFPPIADYAFLSDCQTTALIAPNGNVEWMCLPRMDSPSVFGAILDRDAGTFRFGAGRRQRARGAAIHPRDDGARDHLGDADGMGDRARCPRHRPLAPPHGAITHPHALPHRSRRRPRDAAPGRVRAGLGRDQPRVRACIRLRRPHRRLVLQRTWIHRGGGELGGNRPRAEAPDRPAPGFRRPAGASPDDAA